MENRWDHFKVSDLGLKLDSIEVPTKTHVSPNFGKFIHPSRILISGPTMSGKSYFCKNLLKYKDNLWNIKFHRVIWSSLGIWCSINILLV